MMRLVACTNSRGPISFSDHVLFRPYWKTHNLFQSSSYLQHRERKAGVIMPDTFSKNCFIFYAQKKKTINFFFSFCFGLLAGLEFVMLKCPVSALFHANHFFVLIIYCAFHLNLFRRAHQCAFQMPKALLTSIIKKGNKGQMPLSMRPNRQPMRNRNISCSGWKQWAWEFAFSLSFSLSIFNFFSPRFVSYW